MKMIIAVIKPHRLDQVRDALTAIGVHGLTVSEVRGYGRSGQFRAQAEVGAGRAQ